MSWLLMNTSREHLLPGHPNHAQTALAPYTPSLYEIGHSLAHINRFTGHPYRGYSVAEHSLLVADMVVKSGHGPMAELCALMHDAHESITGDVATPVKEVLGDAWYRFERAEQNALLGAYGLVDAMAEHAKTIKHYDLTALTTERRDLLPYYPRINTPWPVIDTPGAEIKPWDGVHLMAEHRVKTTPTEWAYQWMLRTVALISNQLGGPIYAAQHNQKHHGDI